MSVLLSSGSTVEPPQQILKLKALNVWTERALNNEHNKSRRCVHQSSLESVEREETPSTRPSSPIDEIQLLLSFAEPPKDIATGFILGSNSSTSDIIIGSPKQGVSGRHFVISFNERGSIILQDISKLGSEVSYNSQPSNYRKRFAWMLPPGYEISVKIDDRIRLLFEVVNHNDSFQEYNRHLDRYLERSRSAVPLLSNLRVTSSTSTTATITPHPGLLNPQSAGVGLHQQPVYVLDNQIGAGQFGQVFKVYDAATWEEYAAKDIQTTEMMDKEVSTLKRLSHVRTKILAWSSIPADNHL
jgi:hypothetical protein